MEYRPNLGDENNALFDLSTRFASSGVIFVLKSARLALGVLCAAADLFGLWNKERLDVSRVNEVRIEHEANSSVENMEAFRFLDDEDGVFRAGDFFLCVGVLTFLCLQFNSIVII